MTSPLVDEGHVRRCTSMHLLVDLVAGQTFEVRPKVFPLLLSQLAAHTPPNAWERGFAYGPHNGIFSYAGRLFAQLVLPEQHMRGWFRVAA